MTWQRWDEAGLCSALVWECKIDSKCSRKSQQGCCQDSDLVCAAVGGWLCGGQEWEVEKLSPRGVQ